MPRTKKGPERAASRKNMRVDWNPRDNKCISGLQYPRPYSHWREATEKFFSPPSLSGACLFFYREKDLLPRVLLGSLSYSSTVFQGCSILDALVFIFLPAKPGFQDLRIHDHHLLQRHAYFFTTVKLNMVRVVLSMLVWTRYHRCVVGPGGLGFGVGCR